MCGIVGFIDTSSRPHDVNRALIEQMSSALHHRGPDARGAWQSTDGRVNFGHCRLSIIDLSDAGAQPMRTTDGRLTLIFNGEIYNYLEIRAELVKLGETFHGTSDTEVLLQAIHRWGLAATLPRLNGMFAFAVWDDRERTLAVARDRFGEKPLYYTWQNGVFIFASQVKAMRAHPVFRAEIAPESVGRLMDFAYIGAPYSIFRDVHKLRPGHFLKVGLDQAMVAPEAYWHPKQIFPPPEGRRDATDVEALIDELETVARVAVRQRMVADVPLGAFLSGGIDSSLVVALMQVQSGRPVKTFTIGFRENGYNEAQDAAQVARHLATEHHELYLDSNDCIDILRRLPEVYDEPFADSSQIPTALLAAFTKRHVTVALSGDCGDEFFGGYNRYFWVQRLWRRFRRFPTPTRVLSRDLVQAIDARTWERLVDFTNHLLPQRYRVRGGGDKMHKLARILDADSLDAIYRELVRSGAGVSSVLQQTVSYADPFAQWQDVASTLGDVERMMFLDQMTYMPDDILCKVDRASMSVGLEARVPFLDNELTSFAWSLPIEFKVRDGVGKWPLRQLLKRYVPETLFNRPKMGFGIPVGDWLRGPLRDWSEDLLSVSSLEQSGFFDTARVREIWREHLSGKRNLVSQLWPVLTFHSWLRTQST